MIVKLRLTSVRMDSVLYDSCAILFFWPIAVLIGRTFKPTGLGLSCFIFSQFVVFAGFPTAVQVALLTIYDMAKAVDRGMVMGDVHLLEKSGGKSGEWKA